VAFNAPRCGTGANCGTQPTHLGGMPNTAPRCSWYSVRSLDPREIRADSHWRVLKEGTEVKLAKGGEGRSSGEVKESENGTRGVIVLA